MYVSPQNSHVQLYVIIILSVNDAYLNLEVYTCNITGANMQSCGAR